MSAFCPNLFYTCIPMYVNVHTSPLTFHGYYSQFTDGGNE